MSTASCLLSEEHFLCAICLDVFNTPVTVPCGHNFCKNCITQNWKVTRRCQCPVCKKHFGPLPDLPVNTFVSEMVSQFRQAAAETASEQQNPEDVSCDICTGIKKKALKSCLVCVASYCGIHLERHQKVSSLKRHKLIDPLENVEDRVCTKHDEIMELFCKTDQVCICQLCAQQDHESHEVVNMEDECEERKGELEKTEGELEEKVRERQTKIYELKYLSRLSNEAADKWTANGVHLLTAFTQFVGKGLTELIETIENNQRTAAKEAEDLIGELNEEISELKKTTAKVKELSQSEDHLHILKTLPLLNQSLPTKDWTKVTLHQPGYDGALTRVVAKLKETLANGTEPLFVTELKRVRQYAVDVTLDPDTAHPRLTVSSDGKQVKYSDTEKTVPDNPERFSQYPVVLGKQSFSSGRFYFEVEVKGNTKWDIGVITRSAERKGKITLHPEGGYWILQLKNRNEYSALADPDVFLWVKSQPQKVGVFVDYEEGVVSFFDTNSADMLYSFTGCSFTNKLYPFFCTGCDDCSAPLTVSAVCGTD